MVQAISPVRGAAPYAGSAPAFASLQAQLQRYEQQLSDCVNCASAKSPQGKTDIDAINARINQLKARMAQAETVKQSANISQVRPSEGLGMRVDIYA